MLNKYGFRICSERKIKRVIKVIDEKVIWEEIRFREMIMTSFFILIRTKRKLLENIRNHEKMEILFIMFDQQNDNLKNMCDSLVDVLDWKFYPWESGMRIESMLSEMNMEIEYLNQLIFDIMCLIKNYDNEMTRYPRCHHYKNKIHTQLFTELGDILICEECVGTMKAWFKFIKSIETRLTNNYGEEVYIHIRKTRMRELRTPPY